MRQRPYSARCAALQFEQLERRLPLAGNVTVATVGANDLKITGDAAQNDISIALVGTDWVVTGNGGTTVTFNGAVGTANVPEPAGRRFRKVMINLGGAANGGAAGADALSMTGLQTLGDLKISGRNGGLLVLDQLNVAGKTTLTFKDGVSTGGIGSVVKISASTLGTGKDTTITTGANADQIAITDTIFGRNLSVKTLAGDNTVALIGTRSDAGGNANSSTKIGGKLTLTTGAGNDNILVLGTIVGGHVKATTGDGNDFMGAAGVVIQGKTSLTSKRGDDVAVIGLRDLNGQTFPPGGSSNQMVGKVTMKMGDGNDLVAAGGTKFGNTVTANLGNGDDTLAEDSNTYDIGALQALKKSRGGKHVTGDNLLSGSGLIMDPATLKKGQFERADVSAIPAIVDDILNSVNAGFDEILLAYGIDLGDLSGGAAGDTDDQISEAVDLALGVTAGTLSGSADVDMYKRTVTAGQVLSFDLDPATFDAVLRLFDSDGNQLVIGDSGDPTATEQLQFTFPTAGDFFISVSSFPNKAFNALTGAGDQVGGNSGSYTLTTTVV